MLNARLIALQGLGFPLTPVAIAVQGLIALIQEEARRDEVHGGGGRRRAQSHVRPTRPDRGVDVNLVRAQWELLEARRAADHEPAAGEEPEAVAIASAAPSTLTQAIAPAALTPADRARAAELVATLRPQPGASEAPAFADDVALLLLLAEA